MSVPFLHREFREELRGEGSAGGKDKDTYNENLPSMGDEERAVTVTQLHQ